MAGWLKWAISVSAIEMAFALGTVEMVECKEPQILILSPLLPLTSFKKKNLLAVTHSLWDLSSPTRN